MKKKLNIFVTEDILEVTLRFQSLDVKLLEN